MHDLIKNDAKRPNVNCIGVIMKLRLLRSNVLFSSRDRLHNDLLGTQSEVSQLDEGHGLPDDVFALKEDVLRFQVSMGDPMVVQLLHPLADLEDALKGISLGHFVVLALVESIPR